MILKGPFKLKPFCDSTDLREAQKLNTGELIFLTKPKLRTSNEILLGKRLKKRKKMYT